jgi:hypothetical protein
MKSDSLQLAVFTPFNILANNFLPLNEALCGNRGTVLSMDSKRTFIAVFLSPFASLIVLVVAFIESFVRGESIQFFDGFVVIVLFVIGFVSISFAFVIIVGLPIHLGLSKIRVTNWFVYCFLGILVPLLYKYVDLLGSEMPTELRSADYIAYGCGGFFVSLAFWVIAVKPHNK